MVSNIYFLTAPPPKNSNNASSLCICKSHTHLHFFFFFTETWKYWSFIYQTSRGEAREENRVKWVSSTSCLHDCKILGRIWGPGNSNAQKGSWWKIPAFLQWKAFFKKRLSKSLLNDGTECFSLKKKKRREFTITEALLRILVLYFTSFNTQNNLVREIVCF